MKIIAHRANTLAIINRYLKLPVDGMEIDVRSCNGSICVRHGLFKTRKLKDLEARVSSKLFGDSPKPIFLKDILHLFENKILLVDIKEKGIEEKLVDILRNHKGEVWATSDYTEVIKKIKRLEPSFKVGRSINIAFPREVSLAVKNNFDFLNAFHITVSRGLVKRAHEAGLFVILWTIDTPKYIERAIRLGADAIVTNKPELAIKFIKKGYD